MTHVLVLGAGLAGLTTATLLARDGHQVTVLERDHAEPPPPEQSESAWDGWQRPGVNQFRLPHFMLPRWWSVIRSELPEARHCLEAAGALRLNVLAALPEACRGPLRPDDARFDTVTARRPVLEAAFAAAAASAGVTVRRGVGVIGLTTDQEPDVPRVTGVLTRDGRPVRADLVVDCGGRRSALGSWLAAVGARAPTEERADCGFVYYGRHFRSADGEYPVALGPFVQHYDSLSLLTLPADDRTWSVVFTTSARDRVLRALRDPRRWNAVLARYPLVAHWAGGTPVSGVDVMAGIEDRHRRLVVDGVPVATGVVALGDAWACTNPSLGRGAAMAAVHACLLRDLLRETEPKEHHKLVRRFDEITTAEVEPLYRATLWFDQQRLRELDGDIATTPYRTDDPRWSAAKALFAASLVDPELARGQAAVGSFLTRPDDVLAAPGVQDRVRSLSAGAPQYPLPGLRRDELLHLLA